VTTNQASSGALIPARVPNHAPVQHLTPPDRQIAVELAARQSTFVSHAQVVVDGIGTP
jgi:hypothetical protein